MNTRQEGRDARVLANAVRQAVALDAIRELAALGHSAKWIAAELDARGIATVTGRGCWDGGTLLRLAKRHGITIRWRAAG